MWEIHFTIIFSKVLIFLILFCGTYAVITKDGSVAGTYNHNILLSLLDGRLLSVDINTGTLLWSLNEDPILNTSSGETTRLNFFPNPKDGSLYVYNKLKGNLERLPYTIPELVQISPTKSTDGLLYTAKKSDVWLEIDPHSGNKIHEISSEGIISSVCPVPETQPGSVFLARTAFTLSVYDSHTKIKRWDTTYIEYSSHSYASDSYGDHIYFSSTTDGILVSIDPLTGLEMWRMSYNSPVVAVFMLEGWKLRKVPLYTVAVDSIDQLKESSALAIRTHAIGIKALDASVQTSLFIGLHKHMLYAVECFADEGIVNVDFSSFDSSVLPQLEGPTSRSTALQFSSIQHKSYHTHVGHYCLPETSEVTYQPISRMQYRDVEEIVRNWKLSGNEKSDVYKAMSDIPDGLSHTEVYDGDQRSLSFSIVMTCVISGVVAALVALMITFKTRKQVRSWHLSNSKSLAESSVNNRSGVELCIGKIVYNSQDVLGHGSHGTIVFKGTFDKRPVAVKRILPECFEMADREVDLLRQSDEHPNVIRYFCMEEDSVFKYIALELCTTTLHEYVEGTEVHAEICSSKSILRQAMTGLAHLHHLGIVHRDIKPRNVLLLHPSRGVVRAVISDFGLCKKLPNNRHSCTVTSGIAGTDGWIAPEVFDLNQKVTYAADIFAMGCVIYFVLTKGCHPFGSYIERQANIAAGDYNLAQLCGPDKYVAADLIKKMISNNCNLRPSSGEVLSHCFYWKESKQLNFFLDVSDRVEKEVNSSPLVQRLESNADRVVGKDWRNQITEDLRTDLKRFRSYHGHSVTDLLRALRNKKHHYRELPQNLKDSIGEIPNGFVLYFTSRFPRLLIHVYNRMETFKNEDIFRQYY